MHGRAELYDALLLHTTDFYPDNNVAVLTHTQHKHQSQQESWVLLPKENTFCSPVKFENTLGLQMCTTHCNKPYVRNVYKRQQTPSTMIFTSIIQELPSRNGAAESLRELQLTLCFDLDQALAPQTQAQFAKLLILDNHRSLRMHLLE